jgi:hypothetical protein
VDEDGAGAGSTRVRSTGKMKTPERVEGEVTKIDAGQGRVTVPESDGTVHEFQASTEALQDLTVGGRVEAKLREASKC